MRVCPLCKTEYEDSIEFCFNDGSPLDAAGDEPLTESSLEAELGFRADESAEFLPPEATGLTGEFEAASAEGPFGDDDDDELEDRDSGIEVVPGGLTSPLDDESMDDIVTDPFATPVPGVTPDGLSRPDVDEGAATLPAPPSSSADIPPEPDSIGLAAGAGDELSLDHTGDEPAGAEEGSGDGTDLPPDGFESGAVAESLDEPPDALVPPETDGGPGDEPDAADPAPADAAAEPPAAGEPAPSADGAPADAEGGSAAEAEVADEPPPAPPIEEPPPPPPSMAVTAQGPISAKDTYRDPLYDSIPPGVRGKRRSKAIWSLGLLVALLLVTVCGWVIHGQWQKRPSAVSGSVQAEIDNSPEDRAPNPEGTITPRDNGGADAHPDGDEPTPEVEAEEPTPEVEAEEPTPADDGTAAAEETEAERLRRERREEREKERREEREKERRERREREEQERAEAEAETTDTGSTGTGGDPWSTGSPGTTVVAPTDPADPWSTGTPGNASAKLTITSNPVGSRFSIDGQFRGETPLTVDVTYGSHNLRVEKSGYQPQDRRIDVSTAKVFQDFALKSAEPEKGKLTVFTHPEPGATLYVDGVQRGSTPVTIEISPGVHSLRVELAGFPTREQTIDLTDLQPGEIRRQTINLE